jgi:hypothetical protein
MSTLQDKLVATVEQDGVVAPPPQSLGKKSFLLVCKKMVWHCGPMFIGLDW